jgi:hypothetical protein
VLGKLVIGDRPREVAYEYSGVLESGRVHRVKVQMLQRDEVSAKVGRER